MNHPGNRAEFTVHQALERPTHEREEFIAKACADDASLMRDVKDLLRAHEENASSQNVPVEAEIERELTRLKPEEPGTRIGPYKLLQQIGEGGFGIVWMAEQESPVRRRVALKIIKLGMDTKEVIARFEAERQALAMMDHPNIAKVLDAGATPTGRPFFVMELVRGIRITEYADQANLSTSARLELFISVCQAVQHAHQKGIIHRDLKPSNILVTLHDGIAVPKVIDFGVAKAMQQRLTERTLFTQFEQMVGTPLYMSPEQAEMSGLDVDTRSDIYSLGVLLYELLAGRTPFDPEKLMKFGHDEMRRVIREEEPVKPSTALHTMAVQARTDIARHRQAEVAKLPGLLRGDLDCIVMKAMEKDRSRRYETANGLAMDIRRHLNNEPVIARPASGFYRFRKLVRRNKLLVSASAVVAVALIGGLSISTWSLLREQAQRRAADEQRRAADEQRRAADEQRNAADEQRQLAREKAVEASTNEQQARRLLYAADITLAQQALNANNLGRARRLLDRHRPVAGREDLRGWEWRYLWQQCRGDSLALLTRHRTRAFSTSFSSDGRRLAVGYLEGRVELWDVPNRQLIKVLSEGGGRPAGHVAFSPVADVLVATGDRPGVVKWHDLAAQTERILLEAPGFVRDLAFSTDGLRLAVTLASPEAALVLNIPGGEVLRRIELPRSSSMHFNSSRISPDRQRLYLTSGAFHEPRLRCVRISDGAILWEKNGRDSPRQKLINGFSALDVSPDGRFLVTGTGYDSRDAEVWNSDTGERITILEGHSAWICRLEFSRDGQLLASAAADQTVRLWDTSTWRECSEPLRGNSDEVHAVAFSPDKTMLATGSKDGVVMLWDTRARPPAGGRRTLPSDIRWARALPDSQTLLAIDDVWAQSVIDMATLRSTPLRLPATRSQFVTPPNYFTLFDGTDTVELYEISAFGARVVQKFQVSATFKPPTAYCPRRRMLAWRDNRPGLHIALAGNPAQQVDLNSAEENIRPISFDSEGKLLLAANSEGVARVWDIARGQRLMHSERHFSPFGIACLVEQNYGFANAWGSRGLINWINASAQVDNPNQQFAEEEKEAAPTNFWPRGNLSGRAFSPDGRTFAIATEAGIVALYDSVERKRIATLHGHLQAAFAVVFSPDGKRLVSTGGGREAAKIWDVETRQELLTLAGQGSLLHQAEFTEDGNTLVVGSPRQVGMCQFWRAPSWREIEEIERTSGVWLRLEE